MTERNPKQKGSNVFDCKPQVGKCPIGCNQCFYNRPDAFYVDINKPHMPTIEEVGDSIMRVNCGHDSNIEREKVIKETEIYPRRFFNTSVAKFDFPAPVVFTANAKEEELPTMLQVIPPNLMFVRLRVSWSNLAHIAVAVRHYSLYGVPVVLTFMAYYDAMPDCDKHYYSWSKRHINSYWCPEAYFMSNVLAMVKPIGSRQVSLCGNLDSYKCKDCRNCETYYWQTMKHLSEI